MRSHIVRHRQYDQPGDGQRGQDAGPSPPYELPRLLEQKQVQAEQGKHDPRDAAGHVGVKGSAKEHAG